MTLPVQINLPIPNDDEYLRDLVYALSTYLQQTNFESNGTYLTLTQNNIYQFIQGTSSKGSGTYANTIIFSNRSNLVVRLWYDISWSSHSGTGNLTIQLPYAAQFVGQHPFIGVVDSDGLTFTAGYTYLTANLTPNTNILNINQCGSGVPTIPLPLPAAGSIRGSITYAGQQFS